MSIGFTYYREIQQQYYILLHLVELEFLCLNQHKDLEYYQVFLLAPVLATILAIR